MSSCIALDIMTFYSDELKVQGCAFTQETFHIACNVAKIK